MRAVVYSITSSSGFFTGSLRSKDLVDQREDGGVGADAERQTRRIATIENSGLRNSRGRRASVIGRQRHTSELDGALGAGLGRFRKKMSPAPLRLCFFVNSVPTMNLRAVSVSTKTGGFHVVSDRLLGRVNAKGTRPVVLLECGMPGQNTSSGARSWPFSKR